MSASFRRALGALLVLAGSGCLSPWSVDGPYACSSDGTCPASFTCDDGVCCKPDGVPACPTRPNSQGLCAGGAAPQDVHEDKDHDGSGNPNVVRRVCRAPLTGTFVADGTDCDDANPDIHPGAAEACNGKDDNCDGQLDEGLPNRLTFYKDDDGDGYGGTDGGVDACQAPPGTVRLSGDCDTYAPSRHPGAPELCNGLDDDCDGTIDNAPFADAFTPGDVAQFPCSTGKPGLCAIGQYTCSGGRRVCTAPTRAPLDVCNGLDDTCDGKTDEQPDCGGPASFLNTPGATYGAFKLSDASQLTARCQKGIGGPAEVATAGGAWTGTGAGYHVWWIQAPSGKPWDLSRLNLQLNLAWTASITTGALPRGVFGLPPGDAYNPVVYLCGATDQEKIRYRIAAEPDAFDVNDTSFAATFPLAATSGPYLVGIGSGFDTAQVRRLELVVYSLDSFTITLSGSTGFKP